MNITLARIPFCPLAIACLAFLGHTRAADALRPNIIVIMADDVGFSDLGCYGGEIDTPNLDLLAANGLRFTQFYNAGRCCPTRASLLTGLYPHQAGMGHMTNARKLEGYQGELNRHCVTLAEVLKPAGYRAYAVGKWHVARNTKPAGPKHNWPLQRGFDRFYGTIAAAGSYFDPGTLTRDNDALSPYSDAGYRPAEFYYTDAITDHATRFIAEHVRDYPGRPLFMYVAYTAAHWPLHAKERDIAKYRGRYDAGYDPIRQARLQKQKRLGLVDDACALSPGLGNWTMVEHRDWEARCMEVYAAQIDCMDQGVGRIVDELRKHGRLDDTLLFFLQDNGGAGEVYGRTEMMTRPAGPVLPPIPLDALRQDVRPTQNRAGMPTMKGPNIMPGPVDTFFSYGEAWASVSNTPFRGLKRFVHEGGIATPLIVHWPARIKDRGSLRNAPGHVMDILATCLDVSGASYPTEKEGNSIKPLEGRSLVPVFDNFVLNHEALYWEHEGSRAVRMGKWKLVAQGPSGQWELYDIEADRAETNNLAEQKKGLVSELIAKWEAYATRTNVLPWVWDPPYRQVTKSASGEPQPRR
jgi:arylsulfatase